MPFGTRKSTVLKPQITTKRKSYPYCISASNMIGNNTLTNNNIAENKTYQNYSSQNPLIWGPVAWNFLHTVSLYYPDNPDYQTKLQCQQFIRGLPSMVPCAKCKLNLNNKIKNNNLIIKASMSRQFLMQFFLDIHNELNKESGKKLWTITDIINNYNIIPMKIME